MLTNKNVQIVCQKDAGSSRMLHILLKKLTCFKKKAYDCPFRLKIPGVPKYVNTLWWPIYPQIFYKEFFNKIINLWEIIKYFV